MEVLDAAESVLNQHSRRVTIKVMMTPCNVCHALSDMHCMACTSKAKVAGGETTFRRALAGQKLGVYDVEVETIEVMEGEDTGDVHAIQCMSDD